MYTRRKLTSKFKFSKVSKDDIQNDKEEQISFGTNNFDRLISVDRNRENNLICVENFVREHCRYDPTKISFIDDVKAAYGKYMQGIDMDIKQALRPIDILKFDDHYEYKRIACCVFCHKRHYARCCDQYTRKGLRLHFAFKNMSLV
jgi:hypothetical protein